MSQKIIAKLGHKYGSQKGGGINKGFWPKYIPLVPDQKLQVRLI